MVKPSSNAFKPGDFTSHQFPFIWTGTNQELALTPEMCHWKPGYEDDDEEVMDGYRRTFTATTTGRRTVVILDVIERVGAAKRYPRQYRVRTTYSCPDGCQFKPKTKIVSLAAVKKLFSDNHGLPDIIYSVGYRSSQVGDDPHEPCCEDSEL
jgi:hypothetical protein